MKHIYQKNELTFSLIWIVLYVVLFSAADSLSADLGTAKILTAPLCAAITVFLTVWLLKNGLAEKYGLCKIKGKWKDYLCFLPLALIASTNLWRGFAMRFTPLETFLYVVSMLGVGFIEEIIFRGFLFKALCRENLKRAVIISSLTFGIGHIVNLLNGAEILPTLLQVCYACAIGFLFTVIFHRSGSLMPCIITHSAVNSLSAFAGDGSDGLAIATAAALTLVSLVYAVWILKKGTHLPAKTAGR
ncbi:MAG: CPBP family intramembrane metalloprotease [Lachnospiraceae bacterium]|nr:CPBP family intramembrane metalloprotease [Lachnospiraceae bacterium]